MHSIASSASARRLFGTSILARLSEAMLSLGLVVHNPAAAGSFAAAGVVAGVYAIAVGVGGPLLLRLVDRRGPTSVLLVSAGVAASLLVAIAVLPRGAPLAALAALAVGIGLATPPVGACLRAQLPALLPDPAAIRSAYAFEASVVELTWIFGPPLVLCIGAVFSTGAALAAGGVILLAAPAAFAAQPASRSWQPARADRQSRAGSLRTPAMRTLVIVLVAVGVLLGAAEVAVTAAAKTPQNPAAAAPLFALWGAGSLAGGLLAARLGGTRTPRWAGARAMRAHCRTPGADPGGREHPGARGSAAPRRHRDRACRGRPERIRRPGRPRGQHHRGLRVAIHGHSGRQRCRSGHRRCARRPHRAHAAFALAGGAGSFAILMTLVRSHTLAGEAPCPAAS